MIKTKDNDTWKYIRANFPIIHLYKNVYLLRQYKYSKKKIALWQIVIVEKEIEDERL